jgi:hypothetical protein
MREVNEEQLDMIEDQTSGELPDDQKDFLKSLESEEALENAEPEQSKAQEAEQAQQMAVDVKTAQMTATMGLDVIEFSLKRFIHPEFEFTSATKEKAIENFGPVLIKYGTLIPAWAAEYEPEINAAIAVGSLVSEGIETAKTLKAKDAAIAEAKQRQKDQQDGVQVAA